MIRTAALADAAIIAEIERQAADAPWSLASVQETLARPTTRAFLADDPPVGHLIASCAADEGEILTLAVLPEARRRGAARQLVAACTAWWQGRDAVAGWLDVRADNTAAKALYESCGWQHIHIRSAYYRDGCDALVMRWSPSSS